MGHLASMVGTNKGRGWVGESDRGSDLKDAGYRSFNQNPSYLVFPAAADLILTPPYRAAPLAAAVLLVSGVELHPLGRACSTSWALVDVERAPYSSVASRLSAAISNTRVAPLIRLYPFRRKQIHGHYLGLRIGRVLLRIQSRTKHIGLAEPEI
jgi:hypothetical protein